MLASARARIAVLFAILAALGALAPTAAQAWDNGQAPTSALARISASQPCAKLIKPAAAAFNTLSLYTQKKLAVNGCASAYRRVGHQGDGPPLPENYGTQWYFREFWCLLGKCGNAAPPGTSNHGWGKAVDVPPWVRTVIDNNGFRFGFCKISRSIHGVLCSSDASHESWHVRWTPGVWKQRPNPGLLINYPRFREGSGGVGQARGVEALQRHLRRHGRTGVRVTGSFGWRTRVGLKKFQESKGLRSTGVTNVRTWRKLRA